MHTVDFSIHCTAVATLREAQVDSSPDSANNHPTICWPSGYRVHRVDPPIKRTPEPLVQFHNEFTVCKEPVAKDGTRIVVVDNETVRMDAGCR